MERYVTVFYNGKIDRFQILTKQDNGEWVLDTSYKCEKKSRSDETEYIHFTALGRLVGLLKMGYQYKRLEISEIGNLHEL